MNKKGFTLIELLAVIIILGILMIIAIPSVTNYINDSRKKTYIDTAKELIGGARNLVNEGKLEMYDTDATYYIDIACLKTENGGKAVSPYGEFVKEKAFVVVTFDGKGYEYYWTSIDDSGQGIKKLVRYDKLDTDDIESDLKKDDIKINSGIDGRSEVILITERNNCQKEGATPANGQVNSETGEEIDPITYPEGKNKQTVETGDLVKIGTEEFYVVKHDDDDLVLLAHYNLKVGDIYRRIGESYVRTYDSSDEGYGLQCSEVKGWTSDTSSFNGTVSFSNTNYWSGYSSSYYDNVYNSSSILYQYVEAYKTILERIGAEIKEARLLTYIEALELRCKVSTFSCIDAPSFVKETSFWLGSAYDSYAPWIIETDGNFNYRSYSTSKEFGVRPVIVI